MVQPTGSGGVRGRGRGRRAAGSSPAGPERVGEGFRGGAPGGISRRGFLQGAGLALGATVLGTARAGTSARLPEETRRALETSPYVYVSPLHPGGRESRCHAEVWFLYHEGDVIVATGSKRWKTRAVDRGWRGARIWVGDFGRVEKEGDRFRKGPSFVAQARREPDAVVFEALLAGYARKYPDEWGKWEPRFRDQYREGTRVLIRYTPTGE